jgi:hypothetical protein
MKPVSCISIFRTGITTYYLPTVTAHRAATEPRPKMNMVVDHLDGPVTKKEIQSFIQYIKTLNPQLMDSNNEKVQSQIRESLKAMSLVYDIQPRKEILDKMLSFCDALLSIGTTVNGQDGPLTWIGDGAAQGDIVGHLANCAKQILKTRAIHHNVVLDGNPHGFGKTYLDRAQHYLAVADQSANQNILGSLLKLRDGNHMYFSGASSYKPRRPVPWNQQMMFDYAFVNLAQAHELLGNDPSQVKHYDEIVQSNIDWFFTDGVERYTDRKRLPADVWGYAMPQKTNEDGDHGSLDVAGLYQLYLSGRYSISAEQLAPIANTVMDVISLKNGQYAGRLNGTTAGRDSKGTDQLPSGFLFMALFQEDIYEKMMTDAGLKNGGDTDKMDVYSSFLWVKHQRSKASAATAKENGHGTAFSQLLNGIRWIAHALIQIPQLPMLILHHLYLIMLKLNDSLNKLRQAHAFKSAA